MKASRLFMLFAMQLGCVNYVYSQALNPQDVQFSENWLQQIRNGVADENLLTAAIVAKQHDSAFASELLGRALAVTEHGPLLLSTAVQNCFSETPVTACGDDSLFEEWIQIDGDNLEPYLYFVVRLADAGNFARALEALDAGLKATQHSIYFYDKSDFVAKQLVSVGFPKERAGWAAELYADSSANYSLYVKVLSTCVTQSIADANWKLACLFLGAKMQNTSEDLMSKVFGGAIQRDVLKAVGADEDVIQLVIEHNEWVSKARDMANAKAQWLPRMYETGERPDSFIEDTREATEFEAILRTIYRTQ
jgi:hypothetical protein